MARQNVQLECRASGANPFAAFPNAYSTAQGAPAMWSAPRRVSALEDLRADVESENWARHFCEGRTSIIGQAEWSAGPERCQALQCFVHMGHCARVLEVGAFCGVGTLALAEASPSLHEVVSLELEPLFAEFGMQHRRKSQAYSKVRQIVGPALESLKGLAREAGEGRATPFDLAVVDADKDNMRAYFDLLWETPGMLSDTATVCVDTTAYKGQPPMRYRRFGAVDHWTVKSGDDEIAAFRKFLQDSQDFTHFECGRLLIIRRTREEKPYGDGLK